MLTVFVAQLSHPLVFGYTRLIGPETSVQPLTGRTSFRGGKTSGSGVHPPVQITRATNLVRRTHYRFVQNS